MATPISPPFTPAAQRTATAGVEIMAPPSFRERARRWQLAHSHQFVYPPPLAAIGNVFTDRLPLSIRNDIYAFCFSSDRKLIINRNHCAGLFTVNKKIFDETETYRPVIPVLEYNITSLPNAVLDPNHHHLRKFIQSQTISDLVIDLQKDGNITMNGGYSLASLFTSTALLMDQGAIQRQIQFINNFTPPAEPVRKRNAAGRMATRYRVPRLSEAEKEARAVRSMQTWQDQRYGVRVTFTTAPLPPAIWAHTAPNNTRRAQRVQFGQLMQRVGMKCARDGILDRKGVQRAVFNAIMKDAQPDMMELQQAIQRQWADSTGGGGIFGAPIHAQDLRFEDLERREERG